MRPIPDQAEAIRHVCLSIISGLPRRFVSSNNGLHRAALLCRQAGGTGTIPPLQTTEGTSQPDMTSRVAKTLAGMRWTMLTMVINVSFNLGYTAVLARLPASSAFGLIAVAQISYLNIGVVARHG